VRFFNFELYYAIRKVYQLKRKVGCLIIHGFAGNFSEIEPLNKHLLKEGFITLCPKLEGHTGNKKDLAGTNYLQWLQSAEEGLIKLKEKCEEIILIGFSMGGLIAINLALKHKISALITLSTPIYYWDIKRVGLNIIDDFKNMEFINFKSYVKAAFRIPFVAMINFKLLLSKTKPLVNEIQCPIFVAQGLIDDTVKHKSAEYIYTKSASKIKEVKYYDNSKHVICCGKDKKTLFKDITMFVNAYVQ